MNKATILVFAAECHARAVKALLEDCDTNGNKFETSGQRYAYVAGMQATLIEKLVDYIKTH